MQSNFTLGASIGADTRGLVSSGPVPAKEACKAFVCESLYRHTDAADEVRGRVLAIPRACHVECRTPMTTAIKLFESNVR